MAFNKAVQYRNSEALHEFEIASREYKDACKEFTKIRIAASHPASSMEQVMRLHLARPVFKEACRVYNVARMKYIGSVQSLAKQNPVTVSNKEILNVDVEANEAAITKELRREAALRELGGEKAVAEIMAMVEERRKARQEGFDPAVYEEATAPVVGNTFAFEGSAVDPLDLDSDPFGDQALKNRGVK
jgi:hypothetical protein